MGQIEEIETIKERNITLKLSDVDVKRLCQKAGRVNLTVDELLRNFIGDLVDGTYSNGSDERMYANKWFERCWFGMFPEYTFLEYLIECDCVEETVDDWEEVKYYKELEELDEEDKEELTYYEECMNERFEDFKRNRNIDNEPVTLDDEMEKVIKWWEEYRQIFN